MPPEFMSDALDDFAADAAEQPDQFARTRAAYAELLAADAAFDACDPVTFHAAIELVDRAVQKVREAIADDTDAYNDRVLVLSLHEPTIRRMAAAIAGDIH